MRDALEFLAAMFLVLLFLQWQYNKWLKKHYWWDWYSHMYLRSIHWRLYRGKRIWLALHRCEHCGKRVRPLQVHHLNYKRLGRERIKDTMVLCKKCHEYEHGRKL